MSPHGRLLVVDDDRFFCRLLSGELSRSGAGRT